jgi:hypothetical protein
MESQYPAVLASIGELKDLSDDTEKNLAQAVSRFTQDFLRQRPASSAMAPAA